MDIGMVAMAIMAAAMAITVVMFAGFIKSALATTVAFAVVAGGAAAIEWRLDHQVRR